MRFIFVTFNPARLGLIAIVAIISLLPLQSRAAGGLNIGIAPASFDYTIQPGSSVKNYFYLDSTSTSSMHVSLGVRPFQVTGEDYEQSYNFDPNVTDATKWLTFERKDYTIPAGKRVQVNFTLSIPKGVKPGGYYIVAFAESDPQKPQGAVAVGNTNRIGSLFYLAVGGDVQRSGKVESWNADSWQVGSPMKAVLRMRNDGNVHYNAEYDVVVSDMLGNRKARITSSRVVLPKTIRRYELDWDKAPAFGFFKVSGTVTYLGKTETLPVKNVLMLSSTFFLVMFGALSVIILLAYITRGKRSNVRRR
jgi:hypothetical protein